MQNEVRQMTLDNGKGMVVELTNVGARIMRIILNGTELVLGYDTAEDYLPERHLSDFGALIGRYANRLAGGRVVVDGVAYQLPQNNGPNCLHGGPRGWQYSLFDVVEVSPSHVRMSLVSPDGDSGFPGEVHASVDYTLDETGALRIDYCAESDKPTPFNITNHSYFNLSGDHSTTILDHLLWIDAERYTPVDEVQIPLGNHLPVEGTVFDFRTPKAIGRDIESTAPQMIIGCGYDHNFVLNHTEDSPQVTLHCPRTGVTLQLFTTAPGLQLYTGNFLGGMAGRGGVVYPRRGAVCLETQQYPDSPNQNWKESPGMLYPGKTFSSTTVFKCTMQE